MGDDPTKDIEDALDLSTLEKLRLWLALPVMNQILARLKQIIGRSWNDPAYFTALCRAVGYSLVAGIVTGKIPVPESIAHEAWWTAVFLPALGLLFPAGQTNSPIADAPVQGQPKA